MTCMLVFSKHVLKMKLLTNDGVTRIWVRERDRQTVRVYERDVTRDDWFIVSTTCVNEEVR